MDSPGGRLLVADDDPDVRDSLRRALGLAGYSVTTATNGADAVETVTRAPVDLIVLDILMPAMDGLSVCRMLRGRGDATPVLALTARDSIDDRVSGLFDMGLLHVQHRLRLILRQGQGRVPDVSLTAATSSGSGRVLAPYCRHTRSHHSQTGGRDHCAATDLPHFCPSFPLHFRPQPCRPPQRLIENPPPGRVSERPNQCFCIGITLCIVSGTKRNCGLLRMLTFWTKGRERREFAAGSTNRHCAARRAEERSAEMQRLLAEASLPRVPRTPTRRWSSGRTPRRGRRSTASAPTSSAWRAPSNRGRTC